MAKKESGTIEVGMGFTLERISVKDAKKAIQKGIESTNYPKHQFGYEIRRYPLGNGINIRVWIKEVANEKSSVKKAIDYLGVVKAYMMTYRHLPKKHK